MLADRHFFAWTPDPPGRHDARDGAFRLIAVADEPEAVRKTRVEAPVHILDEET